MDRRLRRRSRIPLISAISLAVGWLAGCVGQVGGGGPVGPIGGETSPPASDGGVQPFPDGGSAGADGQADGKDGGTAQSPDRDAGPGNAADGGQMPDGEVPAGPLAEGIRIGSVSVNQGVEVSVVVDREVVKEADRVAPLISGRPALVSMFWSLEAGFVERDLVGHLVLSGEGGSTKVYSNRRQVSGSPDPSSMSDGFRWRVVAEDITAETTFYVSVEEADGVARGGDSSGARFPASGGLSLSAWSDRMLLDVVVIPTCGQILSDNDKELLRTFLYNTYPINELRLDFRDTISDVCSINEATFDYLPRVRAEEGSPPYRHYGAIVRGSCGGIAQFLDETSEDANRVFSVCDWRDAGPTADLFAHELGHSHGRRHSFEDNGYPHENRGDCGARVTRGHGLLPGEMPSTHYSNDIEIGYDWVQMQGLIPPTDPSDCDNHFSSWSDFMSYSYPYWVSDYTYRRIADNVRLTSGWASTSRFRAASAETMGTTLVGLLADGTIYWTAQRGPASRVQSSQPLPTRARFLEGATEVGSHEVRIGAVHRDPPAGTSTLSPAAVPFLTVEVPQGLVGDRFEVTYEGVTSSISLDDLHYAD